ncbi:MAG: helix-turn-helix domain-containing protein [Clostridia bacterium]|nr:helix-turn-helix domain-containing protein [Clostridia bacterium]
MKAFYESRSSQIFTGEMTRFPYPLHVHETVEIAVVLTGRCVMEIDGKTYVLTPGDAAIAFPLTPHSFDEVSEDATGFSAFLPADTIAEFSSTFHTLLPDEPVVRKKQFAQEEAMYAVKKLLEIGEKKDEFARLAYLHVLLAYLLHMMKFHSAAAYRERGLSVKVVRYMYAHACENITICSAAHDLGISESHLSHLFAQQFHVNFRSFINAIRIDKATMLMRDPFMTLTQIYYLCGYDNMRTFRRAFVQETGMLPAAYMRSVRAQATQPSD